MKYIKMFAQFVNEDYRDVPSREIATDRKAVLKTGMEWSQIEGTPFVKDSEYGSAIVSAITRKKIKIPNTFINKFQSFFAKSITPELRKIVGRMYATSEYDDIVLAVADKIYDMIAYEHTRYNKKEFLKSVKERETNPFFLDIVKIQKLGGKLGRVPTGSDNESSLVDDRAWSFGFSVQLLYVVVNDLIQDIDSATGTLF